MRVTNPTARNTMYEARQLQVQSKMARDQADPEVDARSRTLDGMVTEATENTSDLGRATERLEGVVSRLLGKTEPRSTDTTKNPVYVGVVDAMRLEVAKQREWIKEVHRLITELEGL